MLSLAALLVSIQTVVSFSLEWDAWIQWKLQHEKTYPSYQEEQSHMNVWLDNYKFVNEHNSRTDVTYNIELNFLADQVHVKVVICKKVVEMVVLSFAL